jgi:hypothetical protein
VREGGREKGREQSNLTAAIVSEMFAHQSLSEHVRNGSHDPWLPTHLAHIMGGILNPNRDLGMWSQDTMRKGSTSVSLSPSMLRSLTLALPMMTTRSSTIKS